MTALDNRK